MLSGSKGSNPMNVDKTRRLRGKVFELLSVRGQSRGHRSTSLQAEQIADTPPLVIVLCLSEPHFCLPLRGAVQHHNVHP
jgi:hypothetical protein